MADVLSVEVVYALPETQTVISLDVPAGSTVCAVIELSGILQIHCHINLMAQAVGIFGEIVTLETVVASEDRIEIYRPLSVDPMEARRLRAKKQAKERRGRLARSASALDRADAARAANPPLHQEIDVNV